jgi:sugar transferase EpsL
VIIYTTTKRLIDVTAAAVTLILLSPVLATVASLVKITFGFTGHLQTASAGTPNRSFAMFKFRTMTNAQDKRGNLLPDEKRVTRLGTFLRCNSLDELPELINILKGDMSIVGPRPLLMQYLDRYTPEQARRHEVKPGLTGWAQVNGRNAISWEEKFKLDVWYVDNQSLWLDLKIIGMTAIKVLRRDGISATGTSDNA